MKKNIIRFLKNEDGQTSTEYILLMVVAAMIVFKFKSVVLGKLDTLINAVFSKTTDLTNQLGEL